MKKYTKQGLWSLFLICAFPLHVWTFILAFRDFSWVTERTNAWDAVGVMSYGLVFAFIESVVIFLIAVLLGFLVSKVWSEGQRVAVMGHLALTASLWAVVTSLFFLIPITLSPSTIGFLAGLAHPLRFLYGVSLALVGLTVFVPTILILRSKPFFQAVQGFFERLSMLTGLYLFFDVIGLGIVIFRNV
jgi:hypothetical protein